VVLTCAAAAGALLVCFVFLQLLLHKLQPAVIWTSCLAQSLPTHLVPMGSPARLTTASDPLTASAICDKL
jgi:hypothetical protein